MTQPSLTGTHHLPRSRRRRLPAQVRRAEILQAGIALIRQRGLLGAGVAEIAAAVGVSAPALYQHFANKEDLVVQAFEEVRRILLATAAEVDGLPPQEALEALVRAHVHVTLHHSDPLMVWMQDRANLPPKVREWITEEQRTAIRRWTRAIRGVHPELTPIEARTLMRAAITLVMSAAIYPLEVSVTRAENLLYELAMGVLNTPIRRGSDAIGAGES